MYPFLLISPLKVCTSFNIGLYRNLWLVSKADRSAGIRARDPAASSSNTRTCPGRAASRAERSCAPVRVRRTRRRLSLPRRSPPPRTKSRWRKRRGRSRRIGGRRRPRPPSRPSRLYTSRWRINREYRQVSVGESIEKKLYASLCISLFFCVCGNNSAHVLFFLFVCFNKINIRNCIRMHAHYSKNVLPIFLVSIKYLDI